MSFDSILRTVNERDQYQKERDEARQLAAEAVLIVRNEHLLNHDRRDCSSGCYVANFLAESRVTDLLADLRVQALLGTEPQPAPSPLSECEVCKNCGQPFETFWLAPDEVWEKVRGENRDKNVCTRCFDSEALAMGIVLQWSAHWMNPPLTEAERLRALELAAKHNLAAPPEPQPKEPQK